MTAALREHRADRKGRAVCCSDGSALDRDRLKRLLIEVRESAGLGKDGRVHVLRHTFSARLSIEGAPPKAIQERRTRSGAWTDRRGETWGRRGGDEESPGPEHVVRTGA
jgi:hypothetical protein